MPLLLELDAFATAPRADVAFDAERHVRLDHAVVAAVEVLGVQDVGVFAGHADAVSEDEVAVVDLARISHR